MKPQIATTKEQSARLIVCGVKPETADMYLSINLNEGENYGKFSTNIIRPNEFPIEGVLLMRDYQPAWSLSALLALLPMEINDKGLQTTFQLSSYPDEKKWAAEYYDFYMDKHLYEEIESFPIEACVRTIEWLTANGYSLNNIEQ